jgi:hypothetical protein
MNDLREGSPMSGSETDKTDPANQSCHVPGCEGWNGIPGDWVQLDLADPPEGTTASEEEEQSVGEPQRADPDCSCRGTGVSIVSRPFPNDRKGPFVITRCIACNVFHDDCAAAVFMNELLRDHARGL